MGRMTSHILVMENKKMFETTNQMRIYEHPKGNHEHVGNHVAHHLRLNV